jgi:GT2 family glycosyltransferase
MTDKFFVTAIVVSHDGVAWLPEVIASLTSQSRTIDRIVAVDTGSTDSSVMLLKKSGISVSVLARDVGFGSAIDHALTLVEPISKATLDLIDPLMLKEEWLWLIHDDCAPSLDSLEKLLAAVEDRPNVAIAGPKLRGWYDRRHLLEVGITIAGNGSRWTGLERREQDQGQHDGNNNEVLSVSTAAMLAKRSVFEAVGGFDPNLELFRDDVDLGWRTHVAGYSVICVTESVAFHAQAAATERRTVDVSEAFLHRPLLLDRRNAAYVLLANSSWWTLPWITIQLIASSMVRAVINLLAKLPGYAADEIGAVFFLITKPADLIQARKERRSRRMLSSRIVTRFIPPRVHQFRATFERLRTAIARGRNTDIDIEVDYEDSEAQNYSDIGILTESFEQADLLTPTKRSIWNFLKTKPLLVAMLFMIALSTMASRNRLGTLSGGAMPVAPARGRDLLAEYFQSWHQIGLGSGVATPPWVALTGIASFITLGNLTLFITLLFWLTPVIACYGFNFALIRFGVTPRTAIVGGVLYSLSPVTWAAINQGRIGTIIFLLMAPFLLIHIPLRIDLSEISWRRVYAICLLVTVAASFSPIFFLTWLTFQFFMLVKNVIKLQKSEESRLTKINYAQFKSFFDPTTKRRIGFFVIPILLTTPWSITLLLHPSNFFLEPGLPVGSGTKWTILALNPGGESAMPLWLITPGIVFLLIGLINPKNRNWGVVGFIALSLALCLASVRIGGHGSSSNIWVGALLIAVELCALISVLKSADELIPNLATSSFGIGHLTVGLVTGFCALSFVAATVWVGATGSAALVKSGTPQIIPEFLAALADTPARPKTLVIQKSGDQILYFISRGRDLRLGEPDVISDANTAIQSSITEIVAGTGISSSGQLGKYGIQYLFLENPVDQPLVRTIDGLGGFLRISSTKDGIIWKVVGSSPRVLFTSLRGRTTVILSRDVSSLDKVSVAGTITLAEKYDRKWRLISSGIPIPLQESPDGLPTFKIVSAGEISLSFDGTSHRALLSIEILVLLITIVLALPAGRRRREVPVEELV